MLDILVRLRNSETVLRSAGHEGSAENIADACTEIDRLRVCLKDTEDSYGRLGVSLEESEADIDRLRAVIARYRTQHDGILYDHLRPCVCDNCEAAIAVLGEPISSAKPATSAPPADRRS